MPALPDRCQRELSEAIELTRNNERMTLNLALSYSGRWDIVQATTAIARRVQAGELDPSDINDQLISSHLSTGGVPDPDLLIRTGGELRISNFLLWEIAYSELFITHEFWPEFRRGSLYNAITAFQQRDRRFGRVKP